MATIWNIDPAHSELQFKVKHMMITNVTGTFGVISGSLNAPGDSFDNAAIQFEASAESVDTKNADRDKHLRSADFFDVENHPVITFSSTSFQKADDEEYNLKGALTIRGITKPIELEVTFEGEGKDPWGNIKAGFQIKGKINRKDFGLEWNTALEAGGVLVGDDVRISGDIQLVKQVS